MGCIFLTHLLDTEKLGISWRKHNIKIGNFVFIATRTIICSNVEFGDNSIIGADSIVTKKCTSKSNMGRKSSEVYKRKTKQDLKY